MDQSTHEVRVKEWSALIRECNASGLNKNQWCKLNNINEKQFYYWQRVVRRETLAKVQLPESVDHPVAQTAFVEISTPVSHMPSEPMMTDIPSAVIRLNNSMSVELSDTASASFIQHLIGALAHAE